MGFEVFDGDLVFLVFFFDFLCFLLEKCFVGFGKFFGRLDVVCFIGDDFGGDGFWGDEDDFWGDVGFVGVCFCGDVLMGDNLVGCLVFLGDGIFGDIIVSLVWIIIGLLDCFIFEEKLLLVEV